MSTPPMTSATTAYVHRRAKPCQKGKAGRNESCAPSEVVLVMAEPMVAGRYRPTGQPYLAGKAESTRGRMSRMATKVAMVPAVWRMMAAMPSASRPRKVRKRPPPMTARSTSCWDNEAVGVEPDKMAWPRKNDANDTASQKTNATTANTTALAASTTGRRGTAAKLARMLPDPYSALMVSPPKTPMASCPNRRPVRLMLVGSNSALSMKPALRQCEASLAEARAPTPSPATTVANRHHVVDRTECSFVHSDRNAPEKR